MTDHDCNLLEQVGEQGAYALLEAAVKRIDEKDRLIRQLQDRVHELELTAETTYVYPQTLVVMDDIPAGFYEGEVDTRDPDDYEDLQEQYWNDVLGSFPYGYCE